MKQKIFDKLKRGDKITLYPDLIIGKLYGGNYGYNEHMYRLGKKLTVKTKDENCVTVVESITQYAGNEPFNPTYYFPIEMIESKTSFTYGK